MTPTQTPSALPSGMLGHAGGTGWDEWLYLLVPLGLFAVVVASLIGTGRSRPGSHFLFRPIGRVADSLERLTGVPGWIVGTVATGLFALLVAVVGFYWDVAWHIDFGRDKQLFTPPHSMIVVGLVSIVGAAVVCVTLATIEGAETKLRFRGVRIPWSAIPLAALGFGALCGFPLDDVWHHFYGVDVTMWGPTHLIMIGGASLTPLALWLVLAEGGVRPADGAVPRFLHGVLAGATLTGLSTFQGEFDFGVPQFQLLYQPVLIAAAAAIGLTLARVVLGRGGAIVAALGFIAIRGGLALLIGPALGHTLPHFPLYVGGALAVEAAAVLVPPSRSVRFALTAALGVATAGFLAEWGWVQLWGRHPWPASVLLPAVLVAALASIGGAMIGAAMGASVAGTRVSEAKPLAAATVGLAIALTLPFPRTAHHMTSQMVLHQAGGRVLVELDVGSRDTAAGARWFETISWQGGGLILAPMKETAPGRYVSSAPVPVRGKWKTLVRLHRGSDLVAAPVYLPADPEIRAPAIPPRNGNVRFVRDTTLLMREARPGPPWVAPAVIALLFGIVLVWLGALGYVAFRLRSDRWSKSEEPREPSPYPQGSPPVRDAMSVR